jgi:hypothetical protein
VILATNIHLAPRLTICEINRYLSNAEMNSPALSVAHFPMLSSTRHVIDNIYAGFSEAVMAGW